MKIRLFSLFMFISALGLAQIDPPVRFEADTLLFDLVDFGGNASVIVSDPADSTNNVAQSTKTAGAETWAGTSIDVDGFTNGLPFAPGATTMTVRVWSPDANIPVRLKVEDASDPTISVETEANTTIAGAWEVLTFDFNNEAMGTAAINFSNFYNKASIFFDFNTTGAGKTYFWDDVEFGGESMAPFNPPVTFEADTVLFDLVDFGGNASTLVQDPTDSTNNVVQSIKTASAMTWAGTSLGANGFDDGLPFASGMTTMTVRVWSPDANTPVLLKAEDASNGAISTEVLAMTTMAGAWETLTFDFNQGTPAINLANTYNKVSIFFNFGIDGATAGEKTYYWDDAELGASTGPEFNPPVMFEADTALFDLIDFGGNASTLVQDPTDSTNNVAQSIKTASAMTWAGTSLGANGFDDGLPFASGMTTMTVRVWSPDANTPVLLKAEDASNGAISTEVLAMTTMAGAWETLAFDFNQGTPAINLANTYNKVSIFFNFGIDGATAGEKTYYWDDAELAASTGPEFNPPVTFEADTSLFDLVDFGGNASTLVLDPTDSTNNVAQSIKTASAMTWAGTSLGANGFDDGLPFASGMTTMSVRVWSPDANTPVLLKAEDASNGAISTEVLAMTTMAGAWETLTFDFNQGTPAIDLANTYNKVSIFFNFGIDGATAGEKTYYWDDVELATPVGPEFNPPVTFEADTAVFNLVDFGGNTSAFVVDPTDGSNNVARSTKTSGAQSWAGTSLGANGFDDGLPFASGMTTMTVRVWSPDANTPVLLKAEDASNGAISTEVLAMTTMAGAWETLTFDFSNGTPAIDFSNTYDKVSIFFNFGIDGATAGEKTYYWDDVIFEGNVGTQAFNAETYNINVYPNPVSDVINIDFPELFSGQATVRLIDVTGKLVMIQLIDTDQATIQISDIATGAYVLSIETGEKIFTKQLLVK